MQQLSEFEKRRMEVGRREGRDEERRTRDEMKGRGERLRLRVVTLRSCLLSSPSPGDEAGPGIRHEQLVTGTRKEAGKIAITGEEKCIIMGLFITEELKQK